MTLGLLHEKLSRAVDADVPTRWMALVLFLLAFGPRLALLNKGFFHHDAILMLDAVKASLEQHALVPFLDGRYAFVAFHIPFYWLFTALSLPIDLCFNLLTAATASTSVVLLYLLVKEVTEDPFSAFASALLFAFMPVHFSGSTHTMIHPFSVCLVLLSFYWTVLGNRRHSSALYAAASVALALAISARFPNVLLLPSLALVYFNPTVEGFRVRVPREKLSRELLFLGAPVAVGLALIYFVQKDAITDMSARVLFLGLFSPILKLGAANILANIGLTGCVLLAVGLCVSFREKQRAYCLALLLWLVVMLFFYGNLGTYSDRFFSILFPILSFFIALGLRWLGRYSRLTALGVLLYLATAMFLFVYPLVKERHAFSGQKEYALWVGTRTEPGAVVIAMDDGVFLRHYGNRQVLGHPQGSVELARQWAEEIKGRLRSGQPVYMIGSAFTYDPGKIIEETVFSEFDTIYLGSHPTEAYHNACIRRRVYNQGLMRLVERRE